MNEKTKRVQTSLGGVVGIAMSRMAQDGVLRRVKGGRYLAKPASHRGNGTEATLSA